MPGLNLDVKNDGLTRALLGSAATLNKHLAPAIQRSTEEMARGAKRNLRKNDSLANSTLINSVNGIYPSALEGNVVVGVNYGVYIEEGTGSGGSPPIDTLLDWIKVRGITPNNPEDDLEDLAYLFQRKIAIEGTEAKPFLEPSFDEFKDKADRRINLAIKKALKEMDS